MGGRQIRPAKVFQSMTRELSQPVLKGFETAPPAWYKAVGVTPPSEAIIRTIPPQLRQQNSKATKPRKLYKPQSIMFAEDALRTSFYKDHPWELARPRVVVESDGMDHRHVDWSKGLIQRGVPLSGESVVQRQLWLMNNEKMSKRKAYDITRRQFYKLRQQEEIERRIAIEEARHVGAYFGKSRLDVGMYLEDREFENWKIWAGKETANREAHATADIETFGMDEEEAADAGDATASRPTL